MDGYACYAHGEEAFTMICTLWDLETMVLWNSEMTLGIQYKDFAPCGLLSLRIALFDNSKSTMLYTHLKSAVTPKQNHTL